MPTQHPDDPSVPDDLAEQAIATVRRWLAESTAAAPDRGAQRLAGILKDPRGLDFTLGFVDRVVRPEDTGVAARNLEQLSRAIPSFLPWYLRAVISFGGGFAPQFPWLVVPLARRVLRNMVGHLVIDATPAQLDSTLTTLRANGNRLNLNLLGEAVLGEKEADRRLAGTRALLERDDVDYVSIKVSAVASQLSLWDFENTVDRVVERLTPLYELAAAAKTPKFINLDMEEFRDLELTMTVFRRLLEQPSLLGLEAGIVLQAYLPDSYPALQRLTRWALRRRAAGGATIKIRVVKGANLAMERIDATLHGWPLATWPTKVDTDANFKRLLDWALTPENTGAVHIGIAGHNLFDIAHAWLLAQQRGVTDAVDVEMLLGMATGQAAAVSRDVGQLVLYTPVVHPREFDSAIGYLVRRLEENASSENFMSGLFDLAKDEVAFAREANRFRASLAQLDYDLSHEVVSTNRTQDRGHALASILSPEPPATPPVVLAEDVAVAVAEDVALSEDVAPDGNAIHAGDSGNAVDLVASDDQIAADDQRDAVEKAEIDLPGTAEVENSLLDSESEDSDVVGAEAVDVEADVTPESGLEPEFELTPEAELEIEAELAPETELVQEEHAVEGEDAVGPEEVDVETSPTPEPVDRTFFNVPDTDPSIAANRAWGRRVIERSVHSTIGRAGIAVARVASSDRVDRLVGVTARAGERWAALPASERSRVLHDVGDVLAAFRGRLIEVMAVETGKTLSEADTEVSEAIDFAHYYAEQALELDTVDGARFVPSRLIVVTPPWNFPVAIPAGSVLAALASGSGVILKPAPQAKRCSAVLADALWEGGIPQELLTLVDIEEGELSQQLVTHPDVDRVILTGGWSTAELFRDWRPDLPLLAETSGKNAIIVTPSADFDLAVGDIVRSAFGHAGQKCSAVSLVIMVGSVAESERFRRQLVDAVSSLKVGYPTDLAATMGPLIEPADGKLLDALTGKAAGQKWLVKPKSLDDSGRLWSPGVLTGVAHGSEFHTTEYFGPVLGLMTAATLDDAIELQNATRFGLTAGLHSLDDVEIERWVDAVDAGNLYVNRGITGAIVRRQPFGGWKRSSVGPGAKAGGPNYLPTLGSWFPVDGEPSTDLILNGISRRPAKVIKLAQSGLEFAAFDRVRTAAQNDEIAWLSEFGVANDVSALGIERNVLRYRPVAVTLRLSEGSEFGDLVRLIAAGARTRSPLWISSAVPLPGPLLDLFAEVEPLVDVRSVEVENDELWLERVAAGGLATGRVRLIGGDRLLLAEALGGNPDVAVYDGEVISAGRIELMAFLREQVISITAHRFGTPD
ncbi:MAG: aldehyde dehydrogenase family protein, partial [Glaciihabitans sp.]|nr:aldehyde dehydrogenase family protein [Glaciihabitans sp.]